MNGKALLKSRRGSTLIEVLCAFLMIALSTSLFATAVGAANQINAETNQAWTQFLDDVSAVEAKAKVGDNKELVIYNTAGTPEVEIAKVQVKLYTALGGGGPFYYSP